MSPPRATSGPGGVARDPDRAPVGDALGERLAVAGPTAAFAGRLRARLLLTALVTGLRRWDEFAGRQSTRT